MTKFSLSRVPAQINLAMIPRRGSVLGSTRRRSIPSQTPRLSFLARATSGRLVVQLKFVPRSVRVTSRRIHLGDPTVWSFCTVSAAAPPVPVISVCSLLCKFLFLHQISNLPPGAQLGKITFLADAPRANACAEQALSLMLTEGCSHTVKTETSNILSYECPLFDNPHV